MTIYHADNTTEAFDIAMHLAQRYHKNKDLVDGILQDDHDLLSNTGIDKVHRIRNSEELVTAMRDCMKDELMFRLGASGWA